jgi:sulfopyruvate decarboxylase subunit alpha
VSVAANENAAATGVLPWQSALAEAACAAGVDVFACVPDGRLHGVVVSLGEQDAVVRTLTREEECIAYACGYGAAGGRVAVLMQCSGLGNCINAIASFAIPYGIGVPIVISMRGTLGERNPSQVGMGRATPGLFELAYSTGAPAALLLEPALGGTK